MASILYKQNKMYIMLKFLIVFTILQTLLQPGNAQADADQHIYEPNVAGLNNPYWPYGEIKNDLENHQPRPVKPCLSRRRFNNPNQGSLNAEWTPTFKFTVKEPVVKNVVSQSLKEEANGIKHNNGFLGKPNEEYIFDKKLSTPAFANSLRRSPASRDDCNIKNAKPILNFAETIEKQINPVLPQNEGTISPVNDEEISDECNETKNTNLNTRRSNSNNENILPILDEKNNKTKDKSFLENEENYVATSSFDSNEDRNYNNNNDEQVQRTGFGATKLVDSSVILVQNFRTCYACSSASDPSCWHPSRRTTVKYCRKGHDACVTRTFTSSYGLVLTRDCGRSCEDVSFPGVTPNYKSCSICHNDLCNDAYCVKSPFLISIMILSSVVKYSL